MITDNLIAGNPSGIGAETIKAVDPAKRTQTSELFKCATEDELNTAVQEAYNAWLTYKNLSGSKKAQFLRTIADEIEALGDTLVQRVMIESGLPEGRVVGERGRTCGQLRLFAELLEEGSWVEARIDEAMPDRTPLPRVDIRKMLQSTGPVAVFAASNFPLAFSTAGGDTASALAAGSPVIVKAHSSHLGTNALVAEAITKAVKKCRLPGGVFSSVQGSGRTVGKKLVQHPLIKAVGFTGSYTGGMALVKAANERKEPIPVYAEMGSINPVFVLNQKIKTEGKAIAAQIAGSVNLGAGQFCTNPGLTIVEKGEGLKEFMEALTEEFAKLDAATMLNETIHSAYVNGKKECVDQAEVSLLFDAESNDDSWKGRPGIAQVSAKDFIKNNTLHQEVFGPFTLLVVCENKEELNEVTRALEGQLTGSILGTEDDLNNNPTLIENLSQRVGRLIFNGVPTGVEVCHAMHHGGPFPSTSNGMYTSVGTDAIKRFVRPLSFQNAPQSILPDALKDGNPLNIWRKVNGLTTKE
ncbi:aldehyde dehydrogenase (NADP(+)) [Zhouia amylolytica]|uniref:aldehyde dehydrogenase (NADP(+)) n=1 Tax=Zhouia amylolytica TaxID=376730 RepID=UPI0020CC65FD|nr:aldehyde dehydrogenase (NADP(+)) [Zhouia amylolytica]MCQ0112195.1 aldehyde dehydrogenase (NADP(+)) [Zhouia amylolytica]